MPHESFPKPSENLPELPPIDMAEKVFPEAALNTVAPIELTAGQSIRHKADLTAIVEAPALKACEMFYDKNIRTNGASANGKDLQRGYAYIDIDYDTLSEPNKSVVRKLAEPEFDERTGCTRAIIPVEISELDSLEEVSERMAAVSSQFEAQPLLWAQPQTLDEIKLIYGYSPDEEVSAKDFTELGYFYDETTGLLYDSEELFQKSKAATAEAGE